MTVVLQQLRIVLRVEGVNDRVMVIHVQVAGMRQRCEKKWLGSADVMLVSPIAA